MKFTSNKPDRGSEKPSAFIDEDGDLFLIGISGNAACICTDGMVLDYDSEDLEDVKRVTEFYPGDSITITFE
jgi:hypothetical protein